LCRRLVNWHETIQTVQHEFVTFDILPNFVNILKFAGAGNDSICTRVQNFKILVSVNCDLPLFLLLFLLGGLSTLKHL